MGCIEKESGSSQKSGGSRGNNPFGHVIIGDLNIIQHESLRKVISHGPKFREPQHMNWKHNFEIIMDAVEDYARKWIKREVD
jgi:hypothetical protein